MDVWWLPLFYRLINIIDFDLQNTVFKYLKLFNIYNSFLPTGKVSYLYIERKPNIDLNVAGCCVKEVVNYLQLEKNAIIPFNSEFISKHLSEIFSEYVHDNELYYEIKIKCYCWNNSVDLNLWWEYDFFDNDIEDFDEYNDKLINYCNDLYTIQILQKLNFKLLVEIGPNNLILSFRKNIN